GDRSPFWAASLAAMMVSTHSSPIFSRILFRPFCCRLATYEELGSACLRASMIWASLLSVSFMFGCTVNFVGIPQHRIRRLPLPVSQDLEETAAPARVAGDIADLLDFQQNHVVVAIQADFVDPLLVTGGFPLTPELLAGARPVHRMAFGRG